MDRRGENISFPDTDGRYRVLKKVSDGGFGAVFLAEQKDPVSRKVALKVVKCGMQSPEILAGFAAERQTLALLHHPSIVTILDAGKLSNGYPYFAMEWIDGLPITQYCEAHQLSTPERLEVFAALCQAVEYAHQRGVIHRDLKPSNILVAQGQDDKPLVKVIDFGIAKALAAPEGETADRHSTLNRQAGTLQYMSPEQARLDLDIDTRADVYSLGAILYELLTGSAPLTTAEIHSEDYLEVLKRIQFTEPPRPSTRLRDLEKETSRECSRHSTRSSILSKSVRVELDWIVMKALEKERSRRYDSVRALASDLLHYLRQEPLSVGPPTGFYRTRKFIARHRLSCGASALTLMALLAGAVFSSLQYQKERKAIKEERAMTRLITAESLRQKTFLQGTEQITLGLTSNLIPALTERGRLDLLEPIMEKVSRYMNGRETHDRSTRGQRGQIEAARAWWCWSRGNPETAREACFRATSLLEAAIETGAIGERAAQCWQQYFQMALLFDLLNEREAAGSACRKILVQNKNASAPEILRVRAAAHLARWHLAKSLDRSRELLQLAEDLVPRLGQGPNEAEAVAELRMAQAAFLWHTEQHFEAAARARQAIGLLHDVLHDHPRRAVAKRQMAEAYAARAEQTMSGARVYYEYEHAANDWDKAAELYGKLVVLDPGNQPFCRRHAELCRHLAGAWRQAGQWAKADSAYAAAFQSLPEKPSIESFCVMLDRADLAFEQRHIAVSKKQVLDLESDLKDLAVSVRGAYLRFKVDYEILRGRIAQAEERLSEAMDCFSRALGHARALSSVTPEGQTSIASLLAGVLEKRARSASALGRHDTALGDAEKAYGHRLKMLEWRSGNVSVVKELARTELLLGELLGEKEPVQSIDYLRRAQERLVFLEDVVKYVDSESKALQSTLGDQLESFGGYEDDSLRAGPRDYAVEERRENPRFDEAYQLSHKGQNKILALKFDEAQNLLRQAHDLMQPLLEDKDASPAIRNEWAFLCTRTGRLHRMRGEPKEALPWLDRAAGERLRLWEESGEDSYRSELTVDWIEKALALRALERWIEAEDVLVLAIDTQNVLLFQQPSPGAAELLDHMGNAWFFLGSVRVKHGDFAGAEAACLRALEIRRELHARAPKKEIWVTQLIGSLGGVAAVHRRRGHLAEAILASEEAAGLAKRLVEWRMRLTDGKARPRYVIELVDAHLNAGRVFEWRSENVSAIAHYEQAVQWAEKFATDGAHTELFRRLAKSLNALGSAYLEAQKWEKAEDCLHRSHEIADNHGFTAVSRTNRLSQGHLAWEKGRRGQAEQALEAIAKLTEEKGRLFAKSLLLRAEMQWEREAKSDALALIQRAVFLLNELCDEDPRYENRAMLAKAQLAGVRYAADSEQVPGVADWLRAAAAFWRAQWDRDPAHRAAWEGWVQTQRYYRLWNKHTAHHALETSGKVESLTKDRLPDWAEENRDVPAGRGPDES